MEAGRRQMGDREAWRRGGKRSAEGRARAGTPSLLSLKTPWQFGSQSGSLPLDRNPLGFGLALGPTAHYLLSSPKIPFLLL